MNRSGSKSRPKAARIEQLTFSRRGGARQGAGRKPKGACALASHAARPTLAARFPVLVTMKLERGLPSLRSRDALDVLHGALRAGGERFGMRLVHFSVQSNHVHAVVEAQDARSLSRGMRGLVVRIARALNLLWRRAGRLFADRFHARILRTPREVRNALAYVLCNARNHGLRLLGVDPCSSGAAFDGWARAGHASSAHAHSKPVVFAPRTWLLAIGWRRHGLIRVDEVPGRRS